MASPNTVLYLMNALLTLSIEVRWPKPTPEDSAEAGYENPGSCGSIMGSFLYDGVLMPFRGKVGSAWQQLPKTRGLEKQERRWLDLDIDFDRNGPDYMVL
jgi:hypothetical protein